MCHTFVMGFGLHLLFITEAQIPPVYLLAFCFGIAPRKMKFQRWHEHKSTQHRLFNAFQLRHYVNCDCRNTLRLIAQFTSVNITWQKAESKVSSIGYGVPCMALWSHANYRVPCMALWSHANYSLQVWA